MLELRPYQREAIDALYAYWGNGGGNGLIVLPTGSGKALVIAKLIEELIQSYPDMRIVNVTHSKTLVEQNFKEFVGLSPFSNAGIYSAGLGRRDASSQIIFAGIQSVAGKTDIIGQVDLVVVDEAHAIGRNSDSLYGQFFSGIKRNNPDSRTAGTTATDYRMDSGRLTEGNDRLFDDVVYEIGIRDLIEQGYLTPLISKGMETQIDLSGVGKRGGEFIPGQLEAAADKAEITRSAVAEAIRYGNDRKAWLFFCSGVDHSEHVRDELVRQGVSAGCITSRTPAAEQRRIIEYFRTGRIRALASANMLTTGFNVPHVDLISMLRPTASCGLFVQICGRGTRNAPGKNNCLVLDHSGNVRRFGPVDMVNPKAPSRGNGEAPVKLCPNCFSLVHASKKICDDCSFEFPPSEEVKITRSSDDAPILSSQIKPRPAPVKGRTFAHHTSKDPSKPDTVKITFWSGLKSYNQWIGPGSQGFMKMKSDRFWSRHGGERPFPKSVEEFLERQSELLGTAEIEVKPDGKYWSVEGWTAGSPEAANDNWDTELEVLDSIPF